MSEMLTEGLIPMNFNFQQAKQQVSNPFGPTDNNYQNYNPMVNMNDPMVRHELEKKRKRAELSAKMQQKEWAREAAIRVLNECAKAIDALIIGNTRKGFTYDDSLILLNSVKNKCKEILNTRATAIDNDVLMQQANWFQQIYANQYMQDVQRYKLEWASNTIAFNTKEGIIKFNPHGLYDIVSEWCYANRAHGLNTDTLIYD